MSAKAKRVLFNRFILVLSSVAAFFGIVILFWILGVLIVGGIDGLSMDVFTVDRKPPMSDGGGLRNVLFGQLVLAMGASFLGIPIGLIAGIWLSEYGQTSRFANFVRDISDIMMSAPSIVIGVFTYAVLVSPYSPISFGQPTAYAGMVALAIMMIPIVLHTTDDMLALVPSSLREAAFALGAPKYKVIMSVVIKAAKTGMLTGILLAFARISGETAPLLFTSMNNMYWTTDLGDSFPSLTVTMFEYTTSPYENWQSLGWSAALILSVFVLGVNILGRIILKERKK